MGATSVSTQHHHLDPWVALISCDWLRMYSHTGDKKWKRRALLTWNNSIQLLSDGSLEIHGMARPAGSQNEGYFQCSWSFDNCKLEQGTVNDWLVSWPGAFRLITLSRLENWEVLR